MKAKNILVTLHKIPKFYQIFWYGNISQSFRRVPGKLPETLRKVFVSIIQKLGEILVFCAVWHGIMIQATFD